MTIHQPSQTSLKEPETNRFLIGNERVWADEPAQQDKRLEIDVIR